MTAFENYQHLVKQVSQHAIMCGRDPHEILLVAVTKNHDLPQVLPAYQAGCRHFGENRVQEGVEKMTAAPSDLHWHLIGTLQKNKVRKVIGKFALIHSVDSIDLANKISICSQQAGVETSILLQVNVSGESSKEGLTPEEFSSAFAEIEKLPSLNIEGLMTIAPYVADQEAIRPVFRKLRKLRDAYGLKHLSMGMSNDFLTAIEEGATILRIGTQIFGKRSTPPLLNF